MTAEHVCEVCGAAATHYRLDALADLHYHCPNHAGRSPA